MKLRQCISAGVLLSSLIVFENRTCSQVVEQFELSTTLMESTFKLEGRNAQGQPLIGTAFIMGRPYLHPPENQPNKARYVLITAAHVLEEMQGDTAALHFRKRTEAGTWVRLPSVVQIRANGRPLWIKHPDADVAVMYIRVPHEVSIPLVSTDLLADDDLIKKYGIHPGDELKCLGFPLGLEANEAGFPVLRSGEIASYPLLPTDTTKTFLFDFRVFKGNSGGPVYLVDSNRTYSGHVMIGSRIDLIMGLISNESIVRQQIAGPYSEETRELQLGLAQVVHANLIKEAINSLPVPDTFPD